MKRFFSFVVAVSARGKVRVSIDQSGKHCGMRKVYHSGACGDRDRTRGLHALNAFAHYHNHHVLARLVASAVKQMSGANVESPGRGRLRWLLRQHRQKRDHRYDEE